MPKIEYGKLTRRERQAIRKELRSTLLHLPNKQDIVALLFDLLTPSEEVMLARRIQVAKRLMAGKSYMDIRGELGVGFPLIQTIDSWLDENLEAYRTIIPSTLKENRKKRRRSGKKDTCDPFIHLRRIYPDKFKLINILLDE